MKFQTFVEQREIKFSAMYSPNRSNSHNSHDTTPQHDSPMISSPHYQPPTRLLRNKSDGSRSVWRGGILVRGDVGQSDGGAEIDEGVVRACSVVGDDFIGGTKFWAGDDDGVGAFRTGSYSRITRQISLCIHLGRKQEIDERKKTDEES